MGPGCLIESKFTIIVETKCLNSQNTTSKTPRPLERNGKYTSNLSFSSAVEIYQKYTRLRWNIKGRCWLPTSQPRLGTSAYGSEWQQMCTAIPTWLSLHMTHLYLLINSTPVVEADSQGANRAHTPDELTPKWPLQMPVNILTSRFLVRNTDWPWWALWQISPFPHEENPAHSFEPKMDLARGPHQKEATRVLKSTCGCQETKLHLLISVKFPERKGWVVFICCICFNWRRMEKGGDSRLNGLRLEYLDHCYSFVPQRPCLLPSTFPLSVGLTVPACD